MDKKSININEIEKHTYMKEVKKLKVSAIENGTVIDHIPAELVFNVIEILKLHKCTNPITFGTNLESKKFDRKGIIKISDKYFEKNEIKKIALFAPKATMIVIKDYKVQSKETIQLPKTIKGMMKCVNPKCITNHENIQTKFEVLSGDNEKPVRLHCQYCEKMTSQENFELLS